MSTSRTEPRTVHVVERQDGPEADWKPDTPSLYRETALKQLEKIEFGAAPGTKYQVTEYVRRDEEQSILATWARSTLGSTLFRDRVERGMRILEEAAELAQSLGVAQEHALAIVRAVYARPVGDITQEFGGALVTLLIAAGGLGVSAAAVLRKEVERIHEPYVITRVRDRQYEKYKAGLAILPAIDEEQKGGTHGS